MYKNVYFWLWSEQKKGPTEGNGRPSKQSAWSEAKFVVTKILHGLKTSSCASFSYDFSMYLGGGDLFPFIFLLRDPYLDSRPTITLTYTFFFIDVCMHHRFLVMPSLINIDSSLSLFNNS